MDKRLIDLHTHTLFSDGRESVYNLLKLAKERDIEVLSITDHDSLYVYDILNPDFDIKIIPGIELSVFYKDKIIHVLGYDIDTNNKEIREYCDNVFETSLLRLKEYIKVLDKHNISIPQEIINEHIDSKYPIQYERLFSIMYKLNIPFNRDILESEFKPIKKDIKMPYLKLNDGIKLIKNANGYPVIAHPYKYKWDNLESNLDFLVSMGIEGIECHHSDAPIEFRELLIKYCNDNNLLISGGSDSHKYYKNTDNKRSLGYGTNNNVCISKDDVSLSLIKLAKSYSSNKVIK